VATNDEDDFAKLLAEYEGPKPKRRREPQVGEEVRGRVVTIGRDAAFVDFGGKSDAMIDLVELRDENGKLTVAVGDEIDGRVVEVEGRAGCVVLRRLGGRGAGAREELQQAYAHRIPVEGVVQAVVKGGVEVQVAGVRGFCPISQLELRHVDDASAYLGRRLTFRITKMEGERNLVLSRRALLEEEQKAQAAVTREKLAPGAVVRGRVASLKDYGAFVDLGGLEGLLHVSEIGVGRIKHPSEALTVGQEVEVQVLKIEKGDKEKISLSLKSLAPDPWAQAGLAEGARRRGTVVRLETFGAFVELAPGVEGLLHVSELSRRPIRHAREAVKLGQELEVVVLEVDPARKRLSLGMAEPGADEDAASLPRAPEKLGTLGDLLNKKKK
jgi:small subunit ribosomal protein S1